MVIISQTINASNQYIAHLKVICEINHNKARKVKIHKKCKMKTKKKKALIIKVKIHKLVHINNKTKTIN